MGVYIKSMKMPDGPWACPLFDEYGNCAALYEVGNNHCSSAERDDRGFPYWCPLAHVPEHGRLIEADRLYDTCALDPCIDVMASAKRINEYMQLKIDDAPTIIPAEEGE